MKIVLERHRYAPELNKAYVVRKDGQLLPLPINAAGMTSIAQVRAAMAPPAPGLRAKLQTRYPAPFDWLNRTYAGRVESVLALGEAMATLKARLSVTHGGTVVADLRLVG